MKVELDGVLLDLDGTLLDHGRAADLAVVQWARALPGWRGRPDDAARLWMRLERQFFPLYLRGILTFQEQRRSRIRAFHDSLATLDEEELDRLFDAYLVHYRANWLAFPDVDGFLSRVRASGLPVGVLTNGDAALQREKLDRAVGANSGLLLLASSELGFAKPARKAFVGACARLGTRPRRTVMIGDDLELDVLAARRAGLQALHVDRTSERVDPGAVQSLEEAGQVVFGR